MAGKKHYFFSDVHLGLKSAEEEKLKEKKLLNFLDSIKDSCGKLFIVGDLFDCWIEYRRVVPKGYFRLLAKLNELSESGIEVNFFSGNHDFWLNTYLRDDVGMKLYDYLSTDIDGKKFFITHGDGLSKGDIGYKIIKKILRSRFNQFLYSLIHPDIGIWLAQGSSKKSRYQISEKAHGVQGMYDFAAAKIENGCDYVIMGHFHKPQCIEIKRKDNSSIGYFITLGDWIKHFSYGVYSEGKFEMKSWGEE